MTLTKKKLDELILDEEMASKEYMDIYKSNPKKFRKLKQLSEDEGNHAKYLKGLRKKLYK